MTDRSIFKIIEDDVMTLLRPQGLFQLGEFTHMERNFFSLMSFLDSSS